MKKTEISYSEAIAQVESIIAKLNTDNFDVDTLASEVKKATELIALCKQKLSKAEQDVETVINAQAEEK